MPTSPARSSIGRSHLMRSARCARFRRPARQDLRARAQISGLLSEARNGRAGYGVLGSQGKVAGKPVVKLIGGKPGTLRAYASSMKRDITPEDEVRRFQGCGIKRASMPSSSASVPSAGAISTSGRAAPRRSCRCRQSLGDGVAKLVDANSGFSPQRRSQSGACSNPKVSPLRGTLPLLGVSSRQRRSPTHLRSMSRAASRIASSPPGRR